MKSYDHLRFRGDYRRVLAEHPHRVPGRRRTIVLNVIVWVIGDDQEIPRVNVCVFPIAIQKNRVSDLLEPRSGKGSRRTRGKVHVQEDDIWMNSGLLQGIV